MALTETVVRTAPSRNARHARQNVRGGHLNARDARRNARDGYLSAWGARQNVGDGHARDARRNARDGHLDPGMRVKIRGVVILMPGTRAKMQGMVTDTNRGMYSLTEILKQG